MNFNRDFNDDYLGKQIVQEVNEQLQRLQGALPKDQEILNTLTDDEKHQLMLSTAVKVLYTASRAMARLLDPETIGDEPEMHMHRILHASALWNSRMAGIGPMLEMIVMLGSIESLLDPRDKEPKKLIIPQ